MKSRYAPDTRRRVHRMVCESKGALLEAQRARATARKAFREACRAAGFYLGHSPREVDQRSFVPVPMTPEQIRQTDGAREALLRAEVKVTECLTNYRLDLRLYQDVCGHRKTPLYLRGLPEKESDNAQG